MVIVYFEPRRMAKGRADYYVGSHCTSKTSPLPLNVQLPSEAARYALGWTFR